MHVPRIHATQGPFFADISKTPFCDSFAGFKPSRTHQAWTDSSKMQKFISQLGAVLALGIGAFAGDITDIKHLVLFMQENRAFDHVSWSKGDRSRHIHLADSLSTMARWLAFVVSLIPTFSTTQVPA
jgi:hypothetical protein